MVRSSERDPATNFQLHSKRNGKRSKQKFINEILHVAGLLENNPYLGQVESLLDEAEVEYRSIVVNHINKIVYYIHENTLEIVVLWDTRREPKSLLDELK